jgi:MinD-like ATPase involved in chromosome partitioning or flagellar assembly
MTRPRPTAPPPSGPTTDSVGGASAASRAVGAGPFGNGRETSAADLTEDTIVRRRAERPMLGWRGAVYSASGGRINPGVSEAEAARNALLRRIRRHLPGAHQIAVSSLKGGVGKTTVSAVLGLTLAEHRGDRVVAVDANPDAGTLADRLTGETGVTVRQMLRNIDSIDSLTAVSHYTSLAGRLQVLASEQDPAMSEAFNREEYERICAVLARFYNIIITDSGTGLVHSAMEGTLALADSLVVVGAPTVDGASRASKTLDWLVAHGYGEMVADATVVLCCDRVSPEIDRERVRAHFEARSRAVIEIPYDPHLATGGRLDLGAMREETRTAFLELGALIADEFSV